MSTTEGPSIAHQLAASGRRFAPVALVGAVLLVHLAIAARSVGPMYLFDEVGYLAAGNVISGSGAHWSLCGSSYSVGYSAVLAPLWWLPVSPTAVYHVAVYVSALLGAAVMWPASALARRFGVTRGVALGIGALVTLVPARALMDNYVIAENPLTLLILVAALYALRLVDGSRLSDHLALGVVAGVAAAVHARALPLVAVVIAWSLVRIWTRASRVAHAAAIVVPAATLAALGYVAQEAMGSTIFAADTRTSDLFSGTSVGRLAEVIVGQAFTQVASWSILTALGLGALLLALRRRLRADGRAAWGGVPALLAGIALAQAGFFVIVLAGASSYDQRFDIPIFGRYLDPFVVPLAVAGACALWTHARGRLVSIATVASLVAIAVYAAAILPRVDPAGSWIPLAVPGLEPFLDPVSGDDRPALALAAAAAAVACLLWWVARRRPAWALATAVIIAAGVTITTDAARVDPFEADVRAVPELSDTVRAEHQHRVVLAADQLPCAFRNKLQFEMAGSVDVVDAGGDYGTEFVIGPLPEWPELESLGFEPLPSTQWQSVIVWAGPGAASG